ncbi:HNH endonuclease [Streptomyces hygroscopicus]|uniref:HNH endonuclease n=1 Tax=Streptomyces hygroscopicus TaxID=1912 RepID=UPI00223F8BC5|nr:HNH endonuclease [Streptomyces hygroscopicus]
MRRRRPCLNCGTLTRNASRCDTCQAAWQARQDRIRGTSTERGYGSQWRRLAAAAVARHRALYGDWCPGWRRDPHPAQDLTADHVQPLVRDGVSVEGNVQVLCRSCNAAKGNRTQ